MKDDRTRFRKMATPQCMPNAKDAPYEPAGDDAHKDVIGDADPALA